jgi:hypothetical protein
MFTKNLRFFGQILHPQWPAQCPKMGQKRAFNTKLAIYALEQVHCWGTYFRAKTGQFENFTHLNF